MSIYTKLQNMYDNINNKITYYYLITNQYMVNLYNYLLVTMFGFKKLIVFSNNKILSFTNIRYLIFIGLTKLINLMYKLRNHVDIQAQKVHITKLTEDKEQAIIIDKDMYDDKDCVTFEDIIVKLNMLQMDGTMMNHMIVNLDLVNKNEKICLKNYMFKYKDTDEQHHHTLKNIFIFNNIEHDEDSYINLKIFKDKKLITQTIPIADIVNKHINHLVKVQ